MATLENGAPGAPHFLGKYFLTFIRLPFSICQISSRLPFPLRARRFFRRFYLFSTSLPQDNFTQKQRRGQKLRSAFSAHLKKSAKLTMFCYCQILRIFPRGIRAFFMQFFFTHTSLKKMQTERARPTSKC